MRSAGVPLFSYRPGSVLPVDVASARGCNDAPTGDCCNCNASACEGAMPTGRRVVPRVPPLHAPWARRTVCGVRWPRLSCVWVLQL